MWCCRAFSFCALFPAPHSSLFPPVHLLPAVARTVRHVISTYALLFSKKERSKTLCGSADESQHSVCVCVLEAALPFHASGDFTVLSSNSRITGSPALSSLHVCIINCMRYQMQLFGPCRHLVLKIKSSD